MNRSTQDHEAPDARPPAPSPRTALAALSLSTLLAALATSVANVALPTLAQAFDAPFTAVQGVVVAYLLTLTAAILGVGRLGDRTGRRRLLQAGLLVFTAASLAAGLAPALWLVIAARAVQGLGAAVMMALSLAFVAEVAPKARTGGAMGLLGTASAIGTALGPSLGGLLIAPLGWRAVFLIIAPLGLVALLLARRGLPADPPRSAARPAGFDPALLRDPSLRAGLVASLVVAAVLMATLVVGPFHLARALGLDAGSVGGVLTLGPLVAAATGLPAGRLVDRLGAARITVAGLVAVMTGALLLALTPETLGVAGYALPVVVLTAGYALFQAANNTTVMAAAGPQQRGAVSGALNLSRNLGLIAGASLMGAVFARAAGTDDLTTAAPAAVAAGTRVTFAVAAALVLLALAIVTGGRTLAARRAIAWALAAMLLPDVAAAKPPAPAPTGFVLRSADGANSLRILGLLQVQHAHDRPAGLPARDALFVHRARVGLVGSLLDTRLRTTFVAEFAGERPRLQFLDVDYTFIPARLALRVGQIKRPFSRSFLAQAGELSTIDRPSPVGPFGDGADLGVMLHNGTQDRLEYAVGVFNGTGPGVPDRVHPLIAARVGYNSRGLDPYREGDLAGGAPRVGVAAAALVDLDADGDRRSFVHGLVDVTFKARGLSLASALYLGARQHGPRWADQRLHAIGHYTHVGLVIARRFEPVARYSLLRPGGEGVDQHDVVGGLNVYLRGHALKWQTAVTLRFQPLDGRLTRDTRVQSQLTVAF